MGLHDAASMMSSMLEWATSERAALLPMFLEALPHASEIDPVNSLTY